MKTTAIQTIDRTHQLIKTAILLMVTILFLTGGTAYASHRQHDYNSGLSITFDYIYLPQRDQYYEVYRQPTHYSHYNDHHYRGHHKQWKNKHSHKHHGKHHGKHRGKHHGKHNRGHHGH